MNALARKPFPEYPAMTEPVKKRLAIERVEPARDERREWLLHGNLQHLLALEANGLPDHVAALVSKIGVGLARAPVLRAIDTSAVELPSEERGRHDHDLKSLDRLNAKLMNPPRRKGETEEDAHKRLLKEREDLEARPRNASDLRWVRDATEESAALARGRGEAVVEETSGVKRILDRDPIVSLTWLSEEQYSAGKTLREAYERRGEDAGAMEITGMPTAAHDHERFVASRFTRAKATSLIGRVERRVAVECRQEPMALTSLRWVCGDGRTLTSLGRGRAYDRNCKALAMALDVADAEIKRR